MVSAACSPARESSPSPRLTASLAGGGAPLLRSRAILLSKSNQKGAPNEIATAVKVSTHTARHHTQHVLGKLAVRSRSRAAALINDFLVNARGTPPQDRVLGHSA